MPITCLPTNGPDLVLPSQTGICLIVEGLSQCALLSRAVKTLAWEITLPPTKASRAVHLWVYHRNNTTRFLERSAFWASMRDVSDQWRPEIMSDVHQSLALLYIQETGQGSENSHQYPRAFVSKGNDCHRMSRIKTTTRKMTIRIESRFWGF